MTSLDIRRSNALPLIEDECIADDNEIIDLTGPLIRRDANVGLINSEGFKDMVHTEVNSNTGFKHWCFTWNNPPLTNNEHCGKNLWHYMTTRQHIDLKYMAWAYEMSDSGTPHYQGYIQLKNKIRLGTMKAKMNNAHIWCVPAKNPIQARKYCLHLDEFKDKKLVNDGDIWEYGTWEQPNPGARSDIRTFCTQLTEGKSIKEAALADPSTFVKYHGGLAKFENMVNAKRRKWMTELFIYTGVPGSGKSHRAFEEAEKFLHDNNINEEVFYLKAPDKLSDKFWVHGYEGEAAVIIDDFYGTISIDVMKNLIDRYPHTVEVKNGSKPWLAKAVWITSNQGWKTWWGEALLRNKHNEQAIQRRITKCEEMNVVYGGDRIDLPDPMMNFNDPLSPLGQLYDEPRDADPFFGM